MPVGVPLKKISQAYRRYIKQVVLHGLSKTDAARLSGLNAEYAASHWNDPVVKAERQRLESTLEQAVLSGAIQTDPEGIAAQIRRARPLILKALIEQVNDKKAKPADRRQAALALERMQREREAQLPPISDRIALRFLNAMTDVLGEPKLRELFTENLERAARPKAGPKQNGEASSEHPEHAERAEIAEAVR